MNAIQAQTQSTKLSDEITMSYTENDQRWDRLLESVAGQLALDRLADDAMAEIRAGRGTSIAFTESGG